MPINPPRKVTRQETVQAQVRRHIGLIYWIMFTALWLGIMGISGLEIVDMAVTWLAASVTTFVAKDMR